MRKSILFLLCAFSLATNAQQYELKSTAEVYTDLQKLHRGLRVLYLAAHPDDENTRLISWLENDQYIETAYLSLTRGQGGQNLIGDEKGDGLGVIRTYELLEARKIDGGDQYFTRAVDFGYSKSAEESFEKWGRKEVLADVVYVIRKFRPHVIVTRFPASEYAGHGHHEASAILAEEAFDLAADKSAFPEQLNAVETWQPEALYFNTSSWWRKELADKSEADLKEEKIQKVNIGVFNPITGMGINEIASLARSKHRCQAFGTWRDRGEQFEFLQLVKGEWEEDLFDAYKGIWKQSPDHKKALAEVIGQYDFTNPQKNLATFNQVMGPKLVQRNMWADAKDMALVHEDVDAIKMAMMGLRVEVFADQSPVVVGSEYLVTVQVYNAGSESRGIRFKHTTIDTTINVEPGTQVEWQEKMKAPDQPSNPFWLRKHHDDLYVLEDQTLLGEPTEAGEQIDFVVSGGTVANGSAELHRKWRDSSVGEIIQPMLFVNPMTIVPATSAILGKAGETMQLMLAITAHEDLKDAMLKVNPPAGWRVIFDRGPFDLKTGQVKTAEVQLVPTPKATNGTVKFSCVANGNKYHSSAIDIDYEHIPNITVHQEAVTKLTLLDLKLSAGAKILYVEGSGDEVDEALEAVGYAVDRRSLSGITKQDLAKYDCVITGIRAFNRNEELITNQQLLLDYVSGGGHMIVQYNTTRDMSVESMGPYPMKLSRDRVTEEGAVATLLNPKHPIFNTPNKLDKADWNDWVQERGLYFAGEWDENYTPLISWHDTNEEPLEGALLIANYGEGTFIYTGISFFRQLPAGVPGAYRLLVNMIEYK